MMRVLVTGSAGAVGRTVVRGLRDRYLVRGLDREPTVELDDAVVGDLGDFDTVHAALAEVDAVVHLGGSSSGGHSWDVILHNNFIGTYNVLEAAHQRGVRRVALASRAGVVGGHPRSVQRTVDLPYSEPDSYYTISKIYAEQMGRMYAERHGMEIIAVRIGNFNPERDQPGHPHHLSHGDAVRVFERAIIHPGVKFEIVYGVSGSNWPLYDVEHGRRAIGYEPRDFSDVPEEERGA